MARSVAVVVGVVAALVAACSSANPPAEHVLDPTTLGDDAGANDAQGTLFCEDDPGALCPTEGSACACTGSTMCVLYDGGTALTVRCLGGVWCTGAACAGGDAGVDGGAEDAGSDAPAIDSGVGD